MNIINILERVSLIIGSTKNVDIAKALTAPAIVVLLNNPLSLPFSSQRPPKQRTGGSKDFLKTADINKN